EVAVAVLDVDEVETDLVRQTRGAVEALYDLADLAVRKERVVRRDADPLVENGVVVDDARLRAILRVRAAVASRVRQLQSYQQTVRGARRPPVLLDEDFAKACKPLAR